MGSMFNKRWKLCVFYQQSIIINCCAASRRHHNGKNGVGWDGDAILQTVCVASARHSIPYFLQYSKCFYMWHVQAASSAAAASSRAAGAAPQRAHIFGESHRVAASDILLYHIQYGISKIGVANHRFHYPIFL